MQFFTSSADLEKWVKSQESPDSASQRIMKVVGVEKQQDIIQICRSIFEEKESSTAAKVLYQILAKYNLVEIREGNMQDKMIRQAQIMRQPGQYEMPLRICPKLPFSVGKRLISTYNCRHYCLDSMVFDDDPERVYCAEAMWRRHVMDKFSREFKDKDGKWVGGYINERFQVSQDDGGNQMELAHGERTRKPRPHQYSTERRLEEARGEETTDLTASNKTMVKLASVETDEKEKDNVYTMFSDIIEMKESGIGDEDIILKVSEHYKESVPVVAQVYKLALAQLKRYDKVIYAYDKNALKKTATIDFAERSTLVSKRDVEVVTVADGQKTVLKMETPVVVVSNGGNPTLQIVDGPDAGKQFKLSNASDLRDAFGSVEDMTEGTIQEAADEVGLNDGAPSAKTSDDFPVIVK